jgi:hypothetical protein
MSSKHSRSNVLRIDQKQEASVGLRIWQKLVAAFRPLTRCRANLRHNWQRQCNVLPSQVLEERLLLAADFDLSDFSGPDFRLEAAKVGTDTYLNLYNRSGTVALLKSVMVSTDPIVINGSVNADDLHIDLSGVTLINASGVATERLGVALQFDGMAGDDVVRFTGNSAVTGNLSIGAESITVDASTTVDATATVSLNATSTRSDSDTSVLTASTSGTQSAAVTVRGTVSGADVTLTAATTGTISAISTAGLLSAHNNWTETAIVTINAGSKITGSNSVTILADRSTDYYAKGRDAKNTVSGNTSVAIGGTGSTTITAGGALSIIADNRIKTTALSPDLTLNWGIIAAPISLEIGIARNEVVGDTTVAVSNTAISQTAGTTGTTIAARRRLEASAETKTDAVAFSAISSGGSVSIAGSYASNLLSGNVRNTISGGSLAATNASVTAEDEATAMVKTGLSASTQNFSAASSSTSFSFGASIAFNMIGGAALDTYLHAAGSCCIERS